MIVVGGENVERFKWRNAPVARLRLKLLLQLQFRLRLRRRVVVEIGISRVECRRGLGGTGGPACCACKEPAPTRSKIAISSVQLIDFTRLDIPDFCSN